MKFSLDERVKHRLVGVVVLLAVATIFLPALMKKSNYHLDEKVNISVKLPEKPQLPKVAIPDQNAMFNTIQVAHVDLPINRQQPKISNQVKAVSISKSTNLANAGLIVNPAIKQVATINSSLGNISSKKLQPIKKDSYVVQLASFSKQKNAELLVTELKKKGYKASYMQSEKQGDKLYKVIVGTVAHKDAAKNLQKQLSQSVKINGLIVKTGVS